MPHIRSLIRAEVFTTLDAVPTLAGRVHKTRLTPFAQEELPRVCIYTMTEESALDGTPHALQRQVTLAVEIIVAGNADIDDAVDDLALLVEATLAADRRRGGLAFDTVLTSTRLSTSQDGENKTGHGVLNFDVPYRTARSDASLSNP